MLIGGGLLTAQFGSILNYVNPDEPCAASCASSVEEHDVRRSSERFGRAEEPSTAPVASGPASGPPSSLPSLRAPRGALVYLRRHPASDTPYGPERVQVVPLIPGLAIKLFGLDIRDLDREVVNEVDRGLRSLLAARRFPASIRDTAAVDVASGCVLVIPTALFVTGQGIEAPPASASIEAADLLSLLPSHLRDQASIFVAAPFCGPDEGKLIVKPFAVPLPATRPRTAGAASGGDRTAAAAAAAAKAAAAAPALQSIQLRIRLEILVPEPPPVERVRVLFHAQSTGEPLVVESIVVDMLPSSGRYNIVAQVLRPDDGQAEAILVRVGILSDPSGAEAAGLAEEEGEEGPHVESFVPWTALVPVVPPEVAFEINGFPSLAHDLAGLIAAKRRGTTSGPSADEWRSIRASIESYAAQVQMDALLSYLARDLACPYYFDGPFGIGSVLAAAAETVSAASASLATSAARALGLLGAGTGFGWAVPQQAPTGLSLVALGFNNPLLEEDYERDFVRRSAAVEAAATAAATGLTFFAVLMGGATTAVAALCSVVVGLAALALRLNRSSVRPGTHMALLAGFYTALCAAMQPHLAAGLGLCQGAAGPGTGLLLLQARGALLTAAMSLFSGFGQLTVSYSASLTAAVSLSTALGAALTDPACVGRSAAMDVLATLLLSLVGHAALAWPMESADRLRFEAAWNEGPYRSSHHGKREAGGAPRTSGEEDRGNVVTRPSFH